MLCACRAREDVNGRARGATSESRGVAPVLTKKADFHERVEGLIWYVAPRAPTT